MIDLSPPLPHYLYSTIHSDVHKPVCPVNLLHDSLPGPFPCFFHTLSTLCPQSFFQNYLSFAIRFADALWRLAHQESIDEAWSM
jgi:hypothetical protein